LKEAKAAEDAGLYVFATHALFNAGCFETLVELEEEEGGAGDGSQSGNRVNVDLAVGLAVRIGGAVIIGLIVFFVVKHKQTVVNGVAKVRLPFAPLFLVPHRQTAGAQCTHHSLTTAKA
jgi:hypothetical protein